MANEVAPPTEWLAKATSGYCAKTQSHQRQRRGSSSCEPADERGGWALTQRESLTWESAVSACLALCARCASCRYVSVSQRWGDCGWHAACDLTRLRHDVPQFLSGPSSAASTPPDAQHTPRLSQGFLDASGETLAPRFYEAAPCRQRPLINYSALSVGAHLAPGSLAAQITRFSDMGTGFNVESAANALHHAICCGSVALLPRHGATGRFGALRSRHAPLSSVLGARRQHCFDFSHVPVTAPSAVDCKPVVGTSMIMWAHGAGPACPTENYHMGSALRTLFGSYLSLEPNGSCASGGRAGASWAPNETLVAHVRSGDIFSTDKNPGYGQPPLEFYLGAWAASKMPTLLVVAEDYQSPVVQALGALSRHGLRGPATVADAPTAAAAAGTDAIRMQVGSTWAEDLRTLLCAEHIALAESSLRMVLLSNRRLRHVYTGSPPGQTFASGRAWAASCETSFWVGRRTPRAKPWSASVEQRLDLLLASGWQATFDKLERTSLEHPACLGL